MELAVKHWIRNDWDDDIEILNEVPVPGTVRLDERTPQP